MKNIYVLMVIMLGFMGQAFAQPGPGRGPKGNKPPKSEVEKIRKNVFTRVLILSDEEAKNFWPVFEKMQGEIETVRREMKKQGKYMMDNYGTLSDEEMDKGMQKMLDYEQQLVDIRKKYYPEFKKVLPIKKVILLQKAEREFKKELLQTYRDMGPPDEDGE
jgi:hypothetical protein